MPVCAAERWDMELIVKPTSDSVFFTFDITKIDNEVIFGEVIDPNQQRTPLTGRCSPAPAAGHLELSLMDFRFIVKADNGDVEIQMRGFGFQSDSSSKIIFEGTFIALAPPNPSAGAALPLPPIGIDEGDTGTGTGTQT